MLASANLALKFFLEIAALVSFAYWGAGTGEMPVNLILAILAPAVAAIAWGVFAAPRSSRRLPLRPRIRFEITFFVAAVFALLVAGADGAAVILTVLIVINAVLTTYLGQWES